MLFSFIVLGIVLLIGLNLSFFSPFKNAFKDFSYLDLYYSERLNEDHFALNDDIILVNIDRLNRKQIAEVIDALKKSGPKVIGLDVIFKETEDPIWDNYLASKLDDESLIFAYSIVNKSEVYTDSSIHTINNNKGYANFNFDTDAVVIRDFQGVKKSDTKTLVSFPVMVAKKYKGNNWFIEKESYFEKERPINYSGKREEFLILESKDIIGERLIPFIQDKIVLVGYLGNEMTYTFDIEDKHYTPMNAKFVGKSPPDAFGLVIHANIVQMLISNTYIQVVPNWVLTILTVMLTFISLAYFIYISKKMLASYVLRLNLVQLMFATLFIWISLLFFKKGILFKITSITAVVVFSMGLIGYYKKLAHYLFKRFKWEGFFYHN
ncbi:CHASE2 domain-containing sensor protein [Maribacter spongiicola]|uniref:CHASE2 domain-containing sensor protein n=2 Tax=Maribacter spongiicola TaxID=1206753 RepID=A0A4R7K951_9FLAO|nr:CHASE2 domain-containing sensor protein [Maribacter spongiicola]